MSRSTTAHFSVTGHFLTQFYRDQVLSGQWAETIETMVHDLPGLPRDMAIDILSGKLRLEGVNEMDVLDDDSEEKEEYLSILAGMFQEYFYEGKTWYKAVAIAPTIKKGDEYIKNRLELFHEPKADNYVFDKQGRCILLQEDKTPPMWMMEEVKSRSIDEAAASLFRESLDPNQFRAAKGPDEIWQALVELSGISGLLTVQTAMLPEEMVEGLKEEALRISEWIVNSDKPSLMQNSTLGLVLQEEKNEESGIPVTPPVPEDTSDRFRKTRLAILEYARQNGGFFFVKGDSGKEYRIPKFAFYKWALNHQGIKREEFLENFPEADREWKTFSSPGLKMYGDSPAHTDIVIGAGIPVDEAYAPDFNDALYGLLFSSAPTDMLVYSGSGVFEGYPVFIPEANCIEKAKDQIVIIPDSNVEWEEVAKAAKLVIASKGGPLSHLAINAMELGINLILVPGAWSNLSSSVFYRFDLDRKEICYEKDNDDAALDRQGSGPGEGDGA